MNAGNKMFVSDYVNSAYYWESEYPHSDNAITMADFLNELDDDSRILHLDESYAEIRCSKDNSVYAVHVSGNGDFTHHKAEITKL